MIFHSEPIENVLKELDTDCHSGLSSAQVTVVLQKYGENRLKERRKKTFFERFIEQFKDVMIILLLAKSHYKNIIE